MKLPPVFDAFIEHAPVSVMVRGTLETILDPERINGIFEDHAECQSTRELTFSMGCDPRGAVGTESTGGCLLGEHRGNRFGQGFDRTIQPEGTAAQTLQTE